MLSFTNSASQSSLIKVGIMEIKLSNETKKQNSTHVVLSAVNIALYFSQNKTMDDKKKKNLHVRNQLQNTSKYPPSVFS